MDSFVIPRHRSGVVVRLGRRAPVRVLGLALAVALLATLFVPLAGSPLGAVAATDEPVATEETAAQGDGETQDAGDGAAADGTETPVAEETPDTGFTADLQADPLTSGIHVNMHVCDRDQGSDFLQWSANCTPGGGFEFDVYGGGVLQQSAVDYISVKNLPAGSYTIREYIPQDYREPTVFCSRGPSNGNGAGQVEVVTYQGYYEFDLGANEAIYCHWFNMPLRLAPDGIGNIWLYKRPCPANPGFDYYSADINTFYNLCDLYGGDDVSYSLYSHVSGLTDYRGIDHGFDAFIWKEVPAGQVTITESGWDYDGYGPPLVYCTNLYPGAPAWFKPDVHDVYASFSIPAEVGTACHWFTIPLDEEYSDGILTVAQYVCPVDDAFDYAGADELTLAERCDIGATTFGLYSHVSGQTERKETGQYGDAGWVRIPAGQVTVTDETDEGDDSPIVTCTNNNADDVTHSQVAVTVDERSATFEIAPSAAVRCLWVAFQEDQGHDDDGIVTVVKYTCPEIDEHADFDWYRETCDEPAEGIYFKLDGASTGNPGDYPTDANGEVSWTEREADHYYLSEEVPSGYGEPVVYCATYPTAVESVQTFERFDVSAEARIEFDLAEGQAIYCYWFNIPVDDQPDQHDGDGNVVVTKWVCPEGYDAYDLDLEELYELCDEVVSGVDFFLYGPATGLQGTTDGAGQVAFGPLPAGEYFLGEELPAGYREPIVVCRLIVGNGAISYETAADFVAVGGQGEVGFDIEFVAGTTWFCDWFNVPTEVQTIHPKHKQTIVTHRSAGAETREFRLAA